MDKFWIHDLRIKALHLSLVRNDAMARLLDRRFGWFCAWDRRWLAATVRVGSICFNVDFDAR